MTGAADPQTRYYAGIRMVPYDLLKELARALAATAVLVIALASVLSSPDKPPVTIQQWAQADPIDFVMTATAELAGESGTAQYGPPYTATPGAAQAIGPFAPAEWAGLSTPIDTAQDFVLHPLSLATPGDPALVSALATYDGASADLRGAWLAAYTKALGGAHVADGQVTVAAGDYGPVPTLMARLLAIARTGGLDGLLLQSGHLYETDFTRPLLFMGDGSYLSGLAAQEHLTGDQWGMMNETGSYPGQTWLWLYTFWYQIPPFSTAPNADLVVVLLMVVLTGALALVPFIPVLRDIPRWVPIYRLIWRRYYRTTRPAGERSGDPG
ncbi:MAG: hypothetical protein M0Z49_00435 [Chloroflexi bacterium]|nr:hypothetical protein [Chloroflexota bacterium]